MGAWWADEKVATPQVRVPLNSVAPPVPGGAEEPPAPTLSHKGGRESESCKRSRDCRLSAQQKKTREPPNKTADQGRVFISPGAWIWWAYGIGGDPTRCRAVPPLALLSVAGAHSDVVKSTSRSNRPLADALRDE